MQKLHVLNKDISSTRCVNIPDRTFCLMFISSTFIRVWLATTHGLKAKTWLSLLVGDIHFCFVLWGDEGPACLLGSMDFILEDGFTFGGDAGRNCLLGDMDFIFGGDTGRTWLCVRRATNFVLLRVTGLSLVNSAASSHGMNFTLEFSYICGVLTPIWWAMLLRLLSGIGILLSPRPLLEKNLVAWYEEWDWWKNVVIGWNSC
jgi:hypothetical protein